MDKGFSNMRSFIYKRVPYLNFRATCLELVFSFEDWFKRLSGMSVPVSFRTINYLHRNLFVEANSSIEVFSIWVTSA